MREGNFFCKSRFFTLDNKGKVRNDITLFVIRTSYDVYRKLRNVTGKIIKDSFKTRFSKEGIRTPDE